MKYIDAEKLIAEIERLKERAQAERVLYPKTILAAKDYLLIQDYDNLLSFIASLQQEQQEVDLAEELTRFFSKNPIPHEHITDWPLLKNTAIHFYELGLNARKV